MEQETRTGDEGSTTPSAASGSSTTKRRINDALDEDGEPNITTKKPRIDAEEPPLPREQPTNAESTSTNDGGGEAASVEESSASNSFKRARHADGSETDEDDDEHRCKRRRLDATRPGDTVIQTSGLFKLPLELLIEILLELKYPQELLAITRTCKYLCTAMLSPNLDFVWKRIRNEVKLPDPEDFNDIVSIIARNKKYAIPGKVGLTARGVRSFIGREAAYAAFVFDGGYCEVCGEQTDRAYTSFALRLRLCSRSACAIQFKERKGVVVESDVDSLVWATVPVIESESLLGYPDRTSQWPISGMIVCRHEDLEAAFHKYKSTEAQIDAQTSSSSNLSVSEISADEKHAAVAISRNVIWMKFCVALNKWKFAWLAFLRQLQTENERKGKALASSESWAEPDLLASTVWTTFLNEKVKRHEGISTTELSVLRPKIAEQIYEMEQKRKRKEMERLQRENRRDIWDFYRGLKKKLSPFPAYSTFCTFPTIQYLQSPAFVESGIRVKKIRDSFIGDQLDHQIQGWIARAETELLESLGFERTWNQRIAGAKVLHPVRRLNARWQCRLCGVHNSWDGSLSFEDVCSHECKEKDLKRHRKGTARVWDATNFVVDEKARALIESCLTMLGREAETTRYNDIADVMCFCDSCDPPILVHFRNLLGHSHRHEGSMKLRLFTSGPAQQVTRLGSTHKLLKRDAKAKKTQSRVVFKCKHCFESERLKSGSESSTNSSSNTSTEERTTDTNRDTQEATAATSNTRKEKKSIPLVFDFNGLRSHLKSKHGIRSIRDEDYCFSENIEFQEVKFAST